MRDLRVTAVQSVQHWEDPEANRTMFAHKLKDLGGRTDMIVLPEMFTTGFSMRSHELAETMEGPTVAWMKEQAAKLNAAIYGSVIIEEKERFFNRGLFVRPDGTITVYNKRHLFRMALEQQNYAAGEERVIAEWMGRRILLQVCYDLRFPVFSRARYSAGQWDYDTIIYAANWPEARRYPWSQLLIARAIENQAFVIGVNRVGTDGLGHSYTGDSVIIDPRGSVISSLHNAEDATMTAALDRTAQDDFRKKFIAGMDADAFELHL